MSDISDDNPHRIYGEGYAIAFWRGNSASGQNDADRADVSKQVHTYHVLASFKLPEQKDKLQHLRWLLDHVFEVGRQNAKAEIRKVLGE